jgi:major type 1 subunit fimbrin (pilin)
MNKLAIALSAALSLGAAASASASTGTVNFTGTVVAGTCSVDIGGAGATTTIPLSHITKDALVADETAGSRRFKVKLSAGAGATCDKNTARLTVRRGNLTTDGKIANTAPTDATNAVVGIYRINGSTSTLLNLITDDIDVTRPAGGPPAPALPDFEFEARYMAENGGAASTLTAGAYAGQMIFDVSNF